MTIAIVKTNLGTFQYTSMLVKELDTIMVGLVPAFVTQAELVRL